MSCEKIKRLFNRLAENYDLANNIISFYTHKLFKKSTLKSLIIKDEYKILDLCCGSGDISYFIRKINLKCEIVGVDFSIEMLKKAKDKVEDVEFIEADALDLPFDDNEFDIVICAFGLRNIIDFNKALLEIKRVLKQNGQFLHLDFEGKSKTFVLYDFIILLLLKLFKKETDSFKYLIDSKKKFYSSKELILQLNDVGFTNVEKKKKFLNTVSYQKFILY